MPARRDSPDDAASTEAAARHRRARALFLEAIALSGEERAGHLSQACTGEPELLEEVESLLRYHEDVGGDADRRLAGLEAALPPAAGDGSTETSPPTLLPGDRLGDLEIVERLGWGGMGEVYRAVDGRLERQVAIKILPGTFQAHPERLARLEREAKALGKLSHPNVATLHALEVSEVVSAQGKGGHRGRLHYLVMELVDGESLRQLFGRGPVPFHVLLRLARQIAEGLKAAHDRGVVHRDVKPANVMVDSAGTVKLLDFGLARFEPMAAPRSLEERGAGRGPGPLTRPGDVMGTYGYMAPEQLRGAPVDRRADVWAFGCCLYEGLTGCNPFEEDSDADGVAAVLTRDPDWGRLPDSVPEPLRVLMSLCLEKDPMRRLQDLGDARWFFERALEPSTEEASGAARRPRRWWGVAGAATLAVLSLAVGLWLGSGVEGEGPRPAGTVRFREVADPAPLDLPTGRGVVVAPDGRSLFYAGVDDDGTSRILRRDLERPGAVPVAGTEGGSSPFVSGDGRWLGFYRDGALYRVPAAGGRAWLLGQVPATGIVGASWLGDRIVFGVYRRGLYWIDGEGEAPVPLRSPREDVRRAIEGGWYPTLLTRDEVLFDVANFGGGGRLVVLDVGTGELTDLGRVGLAAQYVDAGYLVWAYGDGLWAARFDTDDLALIGPPVRALELDTYRFGSVDFSVSRSGTLASLGPGSMRLVEVTLEGRRLPLEVDPGLLRLPRWSPDGRWLAYVRGGVPYAQIWLLEVASGRTDRLVHEGPTVYPVWLDKDELLYFDPPPLDTSMSVRLGRAPVDHRLVPSVAYESPTAVIPLSLAGEGSILVRRDDDLWLVDLEADATRRWLGSDSIELNAAVSPDGRWVAYDSNATGEWQVFLRALEATGGARPVSVEGCSEPAWSADGESLYYRCGSELRAVAVRAGRSGIDVGEDRLVVESFPRPAFDGNRSYDPSPTGGGFVAVETTGEARLSVVVDWARQLRELVPGDEP